MRSLHLKTNTNPPSGTYPYGQIRNNDGTGNGTPVNEEVYGDIHQFFERLMAASSIAPNELPDNAYSGFQLYSALLAILGGNHRKTIPIVNWDMNADEIKNVAHGFSDPTVIRGVYGVVRGDSGFEQNIYPFGCINSPDQIQVAINNINATDVVLRRPVGSSLTGANFDQVAGYVRGWLIIEHTPIT